MGNKKKGPRKLWWTHKPHKIKTGMPDILFKKKDMPYKSHDGAAPSIENISGNLRKVTFRLINKVFFLFFFFRSIKPFQKYARPQKRAEV